MTTRSRSKRARKPGKKSHQRICSQLRPLEQRGLQVVNHPAEHSDPVPTSELSSNDTTVHIAVVLFLAQSESVAAFNRVWHSGLDGDTARDDGRSAVAVSVLQDVGSHLATRVPLMRLSTIAYLPELEVPDESELLWDDEALIDALAESEGQLNADGVSVAKRILALIVDDPSGLDHVNWPAVLGELGASVQVFVLNLDRDFVPELSFAHVVGPSVGTDDETAVQLFLRAATWAFGPGAFESAYVNEDTIKAPGREEVSESHQCSQVPVADGLVYGRDARAERRAAAKATVVEQITSVSFRRIGKSVQLTFRWPAGASAILISFPKDCQRDPFRLARATYEARGVVLDIGAQEVTLSIRPDFGEGHADGTPYEITVPGALPDVTYDVFSLVGYPFRVNLRSQVAVSLDRVVVVAGYEATMPMAIRDGEVLTQETDVSVLPGIALWISLEGAMPRRRPRWLVVFGELDGVEFPLTPRNPRKIRFGRR